MPGIGPKYEQLLLAKRVASIESLREVYIKQADRKEKQMISFLQVGTPPPPGGLRAGLGIIRLAHLPPVDVQWLRYCCKVFRGPFRPDPRRGCSAGRHRHQA